jgi:hypothetical protein
MPTKEETILKEGLIQPPFSDERAPSCEVLANFKAINVDCEGNIIPVNEAKKVAARVGFENNPKLIEQAEAMGITPAKLQAMKEYAANLVRHDKKMKQSTVRRKTLEKFKIKLI